MDYKQKMFYRMPGQEGMPKMPFYMAYPMQTAYLEELEYERDRQKLKDLCPKEVRAIQRMVEDECDKMEYDGSLMFDEYPDKVMLEKIVRRIYDGASAEGLGAGELSAGMEILAPGAEAYGGDPNACRIGGAEPERDARGQYEAEQYENDMQAEELPLEGRMVSRRGGPGGRPPGGWKPKPPHGEQKDGLRNLIEALLYDEMYQRRCRHKRCSRWW